LTIHRNFSSMVAIELFNHQRKTNVINNASWRLTFTTDDVHLLEQLLRLFLNNFLYLPLSQANSYTKILWFLMFSSGLNSFLIGAITQPDKGNIYSILSRNTSTFQASSTIEPVLGPNRSASRQFLSHFLICLLLNHILFCFYQALHK